VSTEISSVRETIEFELAEIESLFQLYQEELFELDLDQTPDLLELTAFASVLHSFYNGIENILLSIAKNIDKKVPSDPNWHKSLLSQMVKKNIARGPVLSEEMKNELKKYLTFRHFFRHAYSFHLEWEELEKLVKPICQVWGKFKSEISSFLSLMES
jgi:uncharacterized protein YutE (UPF0331/DUF86 family)